MNVGLLMNIFSLKCKRAREVLKRVRVTEGRRAREVSEKETYIVIYCNYVYSGRLLIQIATSLLKRNKGILGPSNAGPLAASF